MPMTRKVAVLKEGKLLMANKTEARVFADATKALNFIRNLIRVSTRKKLTLDDFQLLFQTE